MTGCQRCGLSCEGVRVVLLESEREEVLARARALGVRYPEEGGALRRVGGRCVLYDQGCRLHAAFGPAAKPAVCRQFPLARAGAFVGVDPACPHAAGFGVDEVPLGIPEEGPTLVGDLRAMAGAFGLDLAAVADRWRAVPWTAWSEPVDVGPQVRAGVAELRGLAPPSVWPDWPQGAAAVRTGVRLGRLDPVDGVVGALVIGAAVGPRLRWFAVWARGPGRR